MLPTQSTIPLASYQVFIEAYDAITLLRREAAYQRARVRRIVMKHRKVMTATNTWTMGYNEAITHILAALKGKP